MVLILILAALGLIGGLWVLIASVRGLRVDEQPRCRACRYNLAGTPGASRCPECGASLDDARAVRVGTRRRRPLAAVVGGIMAAASLSLVTALLVRMAKETDWTRAGPAWWVIRQTQSNRPDKAAAAHAELVNRLASGELSNRAVRRLALQGLDYRDNGAPCGSWGMTYGNFINEAWSRGLLSDAEIARHAAGAVSLHWRGPSRRTYEGAPPNPSLAVIPMHYLGTPWLTVGTTFRIDWELQRLEAELDGEPIEVDLRVHQGDDPDRQVQGGPSLGTATVELPADWEGKTLTMRWKI